MNEASDSSGCLRTGCLGCGGVAVVILFGVTLLALLPLLTRRGSGEPVEQNLEHALPELPTELVEALDGAAAVEADPTRGDVERPLQLGDPPAGRIELDLSTGDFSIVPGPPGDPIRVEARFDERSFRLEEELEEQPDGSFLYHLDFGPRGLLGGITTDNRGAYLELIIPRGYPVDLVGTLGVGRTEADFGGLWLRDVDLRLGTGEHRIRFSEPTPLPMRDFRLRKSVGKLEVESLGAASPASVAIRQRIGECWVDLRGEWRQDSTIDLRLGIGASRVRLPSDVGVELSRARVSIGERDIDLADAGQPREDAPLLTLTIQGSIGEIDVD